MPERRTALYRLLAADGTLLYVGITDELGRRFSQHRKEKSWWPQVTGMMLAFYDTQSEAAEAERASIWGEYPVHNIRNTPRHGEVVRAALRLSPEQEAVAARHRREWDEHLRRMFSGRLAG